MRPRVLVTFEIQNRSQCSHHHSKPFYRNTSNQNFEIANLFKIVKNSNNYASGVDPPPASGARTVCYESFLLLTYKVLWKEQSINFGGGSFE